MFRKHTTLLLSAIAALSILIMSCEGPEGPQGPQGPAGETVSINCMDCHNESTLLKAKIMQYEESAHFLGTTYQRYGTRGPCAPCHANEGFNQWVETGMMDMDGIDEPTPPACRTCHNIHENFDETDYQLKGTGEFALIGDLTDNHTVDMGTGNQCGKCHQTRERNYGLTVDGSGTIEISDHWGPHYGAQTNMHVGYGGFEIGGNYSKTHAHNGQGVPNGCVSCHANTANHTFEATDESCESCHSDFNRIADYRGFQNEISGLLVELREHLVAEGILATSPDDIMGHPIPEETTSHNKAGAMFNYLLVVNDGSLGLHNPPYIKRLLEQSIAVFE